MKIDTKNKLIEHTVQDLYSAENQLIDALTKLSKEAKSSSLKEALESHLEETKLHASRLEEVASLLEIEPNGEDCVGIKGIIKEGEKGLESTEGDTLIDAVIIGGGQKAEHYEMAVYEDLIMHLESQGNTEAVDILYETLNEEIAASKKLTEIAEDNE